MTAEQVIATLKDHRETADKRELTLAIDLFGIDFCEHLDGQPVTLIAKSATGHMP